jgi:hypothetical protein
MSANAAGLPLAQSRFRFPFSSVAAEADAVTSPDLEDLLAPARWTPKGKPDPEIRKVLGTIQTHLSETRRLIASQSLDDAPALGELKALAEQSPSDLTIDSAWDLSGAFKRLNLRLGDEAFLASRLEFELGRAGAQWHGWNAHFDAAELRTLVKAYRARRATPAQHAQAVDRLTFLYLMREEAGRDRRARAALKYLYLTRLAPLLVVLLVGLGVTVNFASNDTILATVLLMACAGALGSTLSGLFKVRDHLVRLDELRGFWPAMRVQPVVGACAGVIVFLILNSQAIGLGAGSSETWSGRGLLAFAAGFSEPFFLGIVQRVAVVPDRKAS